MTVQVPPVVVQVDVLVLVELKCPPSAMKLITVESGTGSARRSEAITVTADVTPS